MLKPIEVALRLAKRVAVISHVRPDGDAIGSSLGLAHFLRERGHLVSVINPSDVPEFLRWLPGTDKILSGESEMTSVEAAVSTCEILFCLDFGMLLRTEHLEPLLRSYQGPMVNIDHHLENEDFTQLKYVDPTASSTCELVYRFIRELDPGYKPSTKVATCLYTGLMTDTGSFRFNTTTPAVHRMAADLVEGGANVQAIHRNIYDNYSLTRTRLLGFCLAERLVVLPELNTAYIKLSREDQVRYDVQPGDTEGIVNYALGIRGINLGIILIEKDDHVKLSFRSVGKFSADHLASHFHGGGHYNAAGGKEYGDLGHTEAKLLHILPQMKEELNYEPYAIT